MNGKRSVGLVGVGGLGSALLRGWLRSGIPPGSLTVCDADAAKQGQAAKAGVKAAKDVAGLARHADVVVVCVKPGQVAEVLDEVSRTVRDQTVVISAAAGVRLKALRDALGAKGALVRAMPNVNVAVQASVTALCAEGEAEDRVWQAAEAVFAPVGQTVRVEDEGSMDVVTALGGSGPAFLAVMLEALVDGAVQAGLPRHLAVPVALGMAQGTARHLAEAPLSPAQLKDMVMSPGGTTAAGLRAREQHGVRAGLMAAIQSATARAAELNRE